MGIPCLTSRLNKSSTEQRLACHGSQCKQSPGVVIDGPSLAHWIYSCIVAGFIADGDTNIRPSFELIKRTTLGFLETLEDYNLRVLHVYFDGGLPSWKRATRFDRLHQDYLQRAALRTQRADFELVYGNQAPFTTEKLLKSNLGQRKAQIDLVTPFLVPLIKESLQGSKFSERIEIVPGEADSWCATFAKEHSATVLTNDSDLAVYDLQEGQMVFFESLKRNVCELCTNQCIVAKVVQPMKVAQALSAKDMKHAAFDLFSADMLRKEKSHRTLGKKRSRNKIASTLPAVTFQEFCSRYSEMSSEEIVHPQTAIQHLDPRAAEIVEQLEKPFEVDIISILPLLIEDPDKKSAWVVSESIREFTYSVLQHTCHKDIVLLEYVEKGQLSRIGKAVSLLDEKSCIEACIRLSEFLRTIQVLYKVEHKSVDYWRTVCSIHLCYYLIASELSSPFEIKSHLSVIWDCRQSGASLSWSQIHFRGQLEATYYAFRQLQQILRYLELIKVLSRLDHLPGLLQLMVDLPGIVDMFEGGDSDQMIDIEYVMRVAKEML